MTFSSQAWAVLPDDSLQRMVPQVTQPSYARRHGAVQLSGGISRLVPQSDYVSSLVHSHFTDFQDVRFLWRTSPADNDPYARAYHFPTLQVGVLHGDYSHVEVYRPSRDYHSHIGHTIGIFGGIQVDFLRIGPWSLGCDLQNGVGFFTDHYNYETNRDNEIIGGVATIYVGAALRTSVRLSPQWMLSLSAEFRHFSNGHIIRPNLGTNTLGPSLSIAYDFAPQPKLPSTIGRKAHLADDESSIVSAANDESQVLESKHAFRRGLYVDLSVGASAKSLLEAFMAKPSEHTHTYFSLTAMVAPMWRYHRIHASGIQLDYMNARYVSRIRELDHAAHREGYRYSPHVLGVGVRHELFYHHVSLHASVGLYLRHRAGQLSATQEGHFYQTIGLRYSFPFTNDRLFVGYNVKAHHLSKADCMQAMLGWRW